MLAWLVTFADGLDPAHDRLFGSILLDIWQNTPKTAITDGSGSATVFCRRRSLRNRSTSQCQAQPSTSIATRNVGNAKSNTNPAVRYPTTQPVKPAPRNSLIMTRSASTGPAGSTSNPCHPPRRTQTHTF